MTDWQFTSLVILLTPVPLILWEIKKILEDIRGKLASKIYEKHKNDYKP